MLRLNIRHELPRISIHQQQGRLDESSVNPAQIHTGTKQARSNKGLRQSSVDLELYQSRRAYGARNLTDLTRENAQRGRSEAESGTSRRAQVTWDRIEEGAKRGNDLARKFKNDVMSPYASAQVIVEMNLTPEPTIIAHPSQVVGNTDVGDVTAKIQATSQANLHYTPGRAETRLQYEGYIRRWLSEGEYDVLA